MAEDNQTTDVKKLTFTIKDVIGVLIVLLPFSGFYYSVTFEREINDKRFKAIEETLKVYGEAIKVLHENDLKRQTREEMSSSNSVKLNRER